MKIKEKARKRKWAKLEQEATLMATCARLIYEIVVEDEEMLDHVVNEDQSIVQA